MTFRAVPSPSTSAPELSGILSADEVIASGRFIAAAQRADGMVPWWPGGHCDPWNHVEAAMALSVCGLHAEAEMAYRWLAGRQLGDGSWFNYFERGAVKDARLDTNVCAYVATGLWHHFLVTGNSSLLDELWSTVERAIDFVLRWQLPHGAVVWSIDSSGRREDGALLTGSCSIFLALRCAVAASEYLGRERPDWELAAGRLRHAILAHPAHFLAKDEFAMDWYYPVLSGAMDTADGRERILGSWPTFVMDGRGVRCVSPGGWVTAAETAECVLALDALGLASAAEELMVAGQGLRLADGSYWTGMVYPGQLTFPASERTTYTAAAMVLAADALSGASEAAGLFRGANLPSAFDLPELDCAGPDGGIACSAASSQATAASPRP